MDLLSGFQEGRGQGIGKHLDQDAWIFPMHTAFSNADHRAIELKRTWKIISSTSSFVHRRTNREMKHLLPPQVLLNPWLYIYVYAYLNIYFLLECNVNSVRCHMVLFPAQSPMSRAVRDSESWWKVCERMNEWMNEAVIELCMECEEKFLDCKDLLKQTSGRIGNQEKDTWDGLFQRPEDKAVNFSPWHLLWWLQGSPAPSGPFFSLYSAILWSHKDFLCSQC